MPGGVGAYIGSMPSRARGRFASTALEIVTAVVLATGLIAALERAAPAVGLGVLYLPPVLVLAVRRGQMAAMACAVLSVLALNFFFIAPRYELWVASSQDAAALAVFGLAALIVGRLAARARVQGEESALRARIAEQRGREVALLADVASRLLASGSFGGTRSGVRLGFSAAPEPRSGERATPLAVSARPAWMYTEGEAWDAGAIDRVREPLAHLLDLALERERMASREAEVEVARRADVAKTAILHAISHDLRSPLTAITTALSALGDARITANEQTELVGLAQEETQRMNRLVADMLDLSRLQAGAADPRLDWCDLRDVLASAAGQASLQRSEHPIRFHVDPGLPLVHADAAQLERAFANLIGNAVKFSPVGDPVDVIAAATDRVVVRILNGGRPIPISQRARIFEPFVRGSADTPGSGLGLAISRGFVEANAGELVLQHTPGDRTAFAASFPLVPQPVAAHGG
jgi:two-component system, OmpR family, sensor histidine kinase KdpD